MGQTPVVLSLTSGSTIVKCQVEVTATNAESVKTNFIKLLGKSSDTLGTVIAGLIFVFIYLSQFIYLFGVFLVSSSTKQLFSLNLINLSILLAFLFIYAI